MIALRLAHTLSHTHLPGLSTRIVAAHNSNLQRRGQNVCPLKEFFVGVHERARAVEIQLQFAHYHDITIYYNK